MNRQELIEMLDTKCIRYEITEHAPVFTIDEMLEANLPHPELIAKNLFVRDDRKRNYFLITVKEDRRVNLRAFQEQFGTRKLSFASETDLMAILGLTKGAVSPFGLLNDEEKKVHFFLDRSFERMGIHPMENTATVWIMADDLIRLIKAHGNEVTLF